MEWSEFAERFSRELAGLDRDTILIVRERDESRHYVQAMREPDRLYAEAVSNNFLDGPLLLTPADEEVLSEAGWRPPTPDWSPANWWTELPPLATPADFAGLAGMMVTALRDVQGVRRPADLVYESFHRHGSGLIELTDFGIEPADPRRVSERRSSVHGTGVLRPAADASLLTAPPSGDRPGGEFTAPDGARDPDGATPRALPHGPRPGTATAPYDDADLEERLIEAKQRGDTIAYFELILRGRLILPATEPVPDTAPPGVAPADPSEFVTTRLGEHTYVIVFTSPQAMTRSLGPGAGPYRSLTFAALAAGWPSPHWALAVNPGLPSEIHLDPAAVARLEEMRRTAEQAAAVDAIVAPAGDPAAGRAGQAARAGGATVPSLAPSALAPSIPPGPPVPGVPGVPAAQAGLSVPPVPPVPPLRPEPSAVPSPATAPATEPVTGAGEGAPLIRPPHGARLWWHREGGAVTPVAVYDATTHIWEPVSVGRRARPDN